MNGGGPREVDGEHGELGSPPMKRKVGVGLIVFGYAALLHSMGGALHGADAEAWPAALSAAVAVAGIMLALIPIRRGERWAVWTSLSMFGVLFATRMATDPRCLVVLDPHQHGCHTFMIAFVLGVVGLVLAGFGRR